jgi:hypothetical protein
MQELYQIPLGFLRMVWDIYRGLAFGFMLASMANRVLYSAFVVVFLLGKA